MKTRNKFLVFLRKNLFYFILGLCILAIGLSVTLVLLLRDNGKKDLKSPDPIEHVTDDPAPTIKEITFCMPVENGIVLKEYCETVMYNKTLNRYEDHQSIDFSAEEGAKVFAVYDGVVYDVTTNYLTGTTIILEHENGLKTVYNSVLDGFNLTKGQKVAKGEQIGEAANTNLQEYLDGVHLHFEVLENDKNINPMKYLQIEEK